MKLDARWLEWQPEPAEGSFAGFAGSPLTQKPNFFPVDADADAYQEVFERWVQEQCVFRERAWGGVRALHNDYVRWCDQVAGDVPAGLDTFMRLLQEISSLTREDLLIEGVLLREDWESWRLFQEKSFA